MMMMMKLDTFLEKTYLNPENNASFSSAVKLYKATKLKFPSVTLSYVKQWLASQDVHTLHKPVRRKFKRNRIVVQGADDQWQVDLYDMNHLAKLIDGNRYILTCIDISSKYAWAFSLKQKLLGV